MDGILVRLQAAGRDRGDDLPRGADLRPSPLAIHGKAKAHLQHVATAAAINVTRIIDWLAERPREVTRASAFARLMAPAVAA
jgi:hypothetical protein